MMINNYKGNVSAVKFILGCFLYIILCSHSGRTDSKGGHYNRSTGEYHYHNGKPSSRGGQSDSNSGVVLLVFGIAFGVYVLTQIIKSNIDKRNDEKKRQKRLEYDQKRKDILDFTIRKCQIDYNSLLPIPDNIRLGSLSNCKFCKRYRTEYESYIKFIARTRYHSVCISCANKRMSLGIGHPIANFKDELFFASNYKILLESLITKSNQLTLDKDLRPREYELKDAFKKELIRRNTIHTKIY